METRPGDTDDLPGDGEPEGDSYIQTHDSGPKGLLSMASGHGVNDSGIIEHSDVTGHDALVTGNGEEEEGSPQETMQAREEEGWKARDPWLWFPFPLWALLTPAVEILLAP